MNHIKITAIGHAGHAVVAHLHRHPVRDIALDKPIDLSGPRPRTRDEIEDHIRVALAAPAAMTHFTQEPTTTYFHDESQETLHAIRLAEQIDPKEPIPHVERCLDDTLACLRSPRVWHSVRYLCGALLRSPRGEMDGARVERVIREGLADLAGTDFSKPAYPRRVYIERGEPRR
jgi:hypothetical protein